MMSQGLVEQLLRASQALDDRAADRNSASRPALPG
jgi:hypothetical protein